MGAYSGSFNSSGYGNAGTRAGRSRSRSPTARVGQANNAMNTRGAFSGPNMGSENFENRYEHAVQLGELLQQDSLKNEQEGYQLGAQDAQLAVTPDTGISTSSGTTTGVGNERRSRNLRRDDFVNGVAPWELKRLERNGIQGNLNGNEGAMGMNGTLGRGRSRSPGRVGAGNFNNRSRSRSPTGRLGWSNNTMGGMTNRSRSRSPSSRVGQARGSMMHGIIGSPTNPSGMRRSRSRSRRSDGYINRQGVPVNAAGLPAVEFDVNMQRCRARNGEFAPCNGEALNNPLE